MGCGIHIILERRYPDSEWVGVWSSDVGPGKLRAKIARRDYGFFQRFGVRGYRDDVTAIYPRNLPRDVSRFSWLQYMLCPTDYHSASHATLDEFCAAWLAENPNDAEVRAEHATYDLFGIFGDEDEGEHRVVFWFDN